MRKQYQHVAVVHIMSPEKDPRRVFSTLQEVLDDFVDIVPREDLPSFTSVEVLGATPQSGEERKP